MPAAMAGRKRKLITGSTWKNAPEDSIIFFSRGQWAIKALASLLAKKKGRNAGIIFIPEYFCEISLTPLKGSDFSIYFYRIRDTFEPDIEHVLSLIERHGIPDIFLYVHYFGFPSNIQNVKKLCENKQIIMVEDAAHSMVPVPGIGDNGHPTIYTPWKFLNLPEGALLVLPERFQSEDFIFKQGEEFSYPLKWIVKQTIISFCYWTGFPLHKVKRVHIKDHHESEEKIDPGVPSCSVYSLKLLFFYEMMIEDFRKKREGNYRYLDGIIAQSRISGCRLFKRLPHTFAPYLYPLRVPESMSMQVMSTLNRKGIPAMPWSDLSPEVKDSPEFPIANTFRREIVTLPVHQDLSTVHMERIANELMRLL